mgnify:CR=1 FL=1
MQLIFLLNGRIENIIEANDLGSFNTEKIKIDEKELSDIRGIVSTINSYKAGHVYFACIENDLQRFHFFMMLFIFLSNAKTGAIVDESGKRKEYSLFRFVFKYVPAFIAEIIASFFVVIYHYIKLPVIKRKLTRKK